MAQRERDRAAQAKARAEAADKAFHDLMQMEAKEKEEEPILGPLSHIRVTSKRGLVVASSRARDKGALFRGAITVAWGSAAGARRVQVSVSVCILVFIGLLLSFRGGGVAVARGRGE